MHLSEHLHNLAADVEQFEDEHAEEVAALENEAARLEAENSSLEERIAELEDELEEQKSCARA